MIRFMQQSTNTKIQIPPQCNPGEMHRVATVHGTEEGCKQVQKMIQRIITEQSSAGVMSGQPPAAHYQYQQPHQPTEGQQGYSAEWAAYHAAQQAAAVLQQQQQQQQQASAYSAPMHHQQQQQHHPAQQQYHQTHNYANQQQQGAQASAAAGQTAPDAYYEQFFRYEYYYGTEAARQYYGAWSPPVGTPNPYGTNPNGIQAAPAANGPAPAASAAAPAAGGSTAIHPNEARETGRRKVSNLPAWMTNN